MGYQRFCTKPSEQGSFFWASWNESKIVVCYNQNLQKHKYLSRISMLLHETFRTGLISPSQSKWVQRVVCYNQNLQKHTYLSGISMLLHKTFRIGLVFLSWSKWVQIVVCYKQNLQKCKYLSELPFWANLTNFFGKIWHCGSFLASLVWKESKKLKNSKNLPMYLPPRNANFWDFGWNEMLWWQKMGKVVNCMKMAIPN